MEELKNLNSEYVEIVEEVCEKYNYTDNLKKILGKINEAILLKKSYEEKQIFYKMLKTTPIIVVPEDVNDKLEKMINNVIGEINPHIKGLDKKDVLLRENNFISIPVLDENLNLTGVKKVIYVSSFNDLRPLRESERKYFDVFKTGINIPALIYELGNAWAAEVNPYTIENNVLTKRIGVRETKYEIKNLEDGKYEIKVISDKRKYLEESINTNFQEETLVNYLNMDIEEVRELYKVNGFIKPTIYQYGLSKMTYKLFNPSFKVDLEKWRISADREAIQFINKAFSNTNYYEKREKLYERIKTTEGPISNGDNIVVARNKMFNNIGENKAKETLQDLEKVFFPKSSVDFSPMDMLDNILNQFYNIGEKKYDFEIEDYKDIISVIAREGYGLINQAEKNVI